jgi:hypothetical protein
MQSVSYVVESYQCCGESHCLSLRSVVLCVSKAYFPNILATTSEEGTALTIRVEMKLELADMFQMLVTTARPRGFSSPSTTVINLEINSPINGRIIVQKYPLQMS